VYTPLFTGTDITLRHYYEQTQKNTVEYENYLARQRYYKKVAKERDMRKTYFGPDLVRVWGI
jgi:hypothetical protein